jgi:flagellar biosynthesis/type III secretory pathway protein FliH
MLWSFCRLIFFEQPQKYGGGAEHKKDPIWAMLKAEMANQGYRKGYDQAMEKSHQLEDRLQKLSAELEQLFRHQYIDEARACR